jgi:hypothetical protein
LARPDCPPNLRIIFWAGFSVPPLVFDIRRCYQIFR